MRVAIVAIGSAGDVHPFLAVGRGLLERGHEVLVLASAWFEEAITGAGLEFAAMDTREHYREMITRPELWDPRRGFAFIMQEGVLPRLRPLYDRLVAERHGARHVTVHLSPAILRTVHRVPVFKGTGFVRRMPRWFKRGFWWFSDQLFDRAWVPQLNAFRKGIGLPAVRRPMNGWWNSPARVLGTWPPWFAPLQPDWPPQLRLTGFPFHDGLAPSLDPGLERWLAEGPEPLVLTHGSANVQGARFFHESLRVCEQLGVRGLLVTTKREDVPDRLPATVRHESYVPFSLLLLRAAALVSHGGIGTVAQGLRAGVPQLVVPLAHDQHDNGSRLLELGVGATLPAERYDAARAAPLLDALLHDAPLRARCAERAALLRGEDAISLACSAILDHPGAPQPPSG